MKVSAATRRVGVQPRLPGSIDRMEIPAKIPVPPEKKQARDIVRSDNRVAFGTGRILCMGWFFFFFFISGFCSILYEIVWLRLAMAQFGVTSALVSIVLVTPNWAIASL